MADFDASGALLEQVNQALANATPLRIQGGNSKAFLGREVAGEVLDTRAHRGIVATTRPSWWSPRAGTPLRGCSRRSTRPGRCCRANRRPSATPPSAA
jgi:glycolate oxidase FAD binding subunit